MSIVIIKGMTAKELLDVFQWARTGANNCMIGHGVVATELPDHGDLIDRDALVDKAEFIVDAYSGRGGFSVWGDDVVNAPVVIPAERSEDCYIDMFRLCNKVALDIAERRKE